MTSDRPYRPALAWAEAGREIVGESRSQFDPAVVKAFVDREERLRAIRTQFAAYDNSSPVLRNSLLGPRGPAPRSPRTASLYSPPWREAGTSPYG